MFSIRMFAVIFFVLLMLVNLLISNLVVDLIIDDTKILNSDSFKFGESINSSGSLSSAYSINDAIYTVSSDRFLTDNVKTITKLDKHYNPIWETNFSVANGPYFEHLLAVGIDQGVISEFGDSLDFNPEDLFQVSIFNLPLLVFSITTGEIRQISVEYSHPFNSELVSSYTRFSFEKGIILGSMAYLPITIFEQDRDGNFKYYFVFAVINLENGDSIFTDLSDDLNLVQDKFYWFRNINLVNGNNGELKINLILDVNTFVSDSNSVFYSLVYDLSTHTISQSDSYNISFLECGDICWADLLPDDTILLTERTNTNESFQLKMTQFSTENKKIQTWELKPNLNVLVRRTWFVDENFLFASGYVENRKTDEEELHLFLIDSQSSDFFMIKLPVDDSKFFTRLHLMFERDDKSITIIVDSQSARRIDFYTLELSYVTANSRLPYILTYTLVNLLMLSPLIYYYRKRVIGVKNPLIETFPKY